MSEVITLFFFGRKQSLYQFSQLTNVTVKVLSRFTYLAFLILILAGFENLPFTVLPSAFAMARTL